MRVCLVGHLDKTPVEGTRKILHELSLCLSPRIDVRTYRISSLADMIRCRSFKPDILHAVIGPSSLMSFAALGIWKRIACPKAVVVSAVHFTLENAGLANMILRPDAVLVQSGESCTKSREACWRTYFVPNGVDENRFVPATPAEKLRLRRDAGLPESARILLHVGPVKYARNVDWLADLLSNDCILLVLSRPTDPGDSRLIRELTEKGARILTVYVPEVERVYQMADGLVFPSTNPRSCIETPLSVLEAMACNLSVVSTRFGALSDMFGQAGGLHFVGDRKELLEASLRIGSKGNKISTRQAVAEYSWEKVADRLESIYSEIE